MLNGRIVLQKLTEAEAHKTLAEVCTDTPVPQGNFCSPAFDNLDTTQFHFQGQDRNAESALYRTQQGVQKPPRVFSDSDFYVLY